MLTRGRRCAAAALSAGSVISAARVIVAVVHICNKVVDSKVG